MCSINVSTTQHTQKDIDIYIYIYIYNIGHDWMFVITCVSFTLKSPNIMTGITWIYLSRADVSASIIWTIVCVVRTKWPILLGGGSHIFKVNMKKKICKHDHDCVRVWLCHIVGRTQ